MSIISEELLKELFNHYTIQQKIQLENQINVITNYITENIEMYSKSKEFSKGIDDILKLVLAGKFIGKEDTNETL